MTSSATKGSKTASATTSQGDVALRDRLAKYVKEMPSKIEGMKDQWDRQDYLALKISARQLKESAGVYGFDQIIPCAQKLEKIANTGQPTEQARTLLDELVGICQRIQGYDF